jgi:hypothetical protein
MRALIELAECRRQDILAEAARYRLADQALPDESLAILSKEVLRHAVQSVRSAARGVLNDHSFHAFNSGKKKSARTTLILAH